MYNTSIISTQAKLQFLLDIIGDKISYGYFRWLDEKEYEDINDYAKLFKQDVEDNGGIFVKMTARPFGFKFTLDNKTFQAYANSKSIGIKPLTK